MHETRNVSEGGRARDIGGQREGVERDMGNREIEREREGEKGGQRE